LKFQSLEAIEQGKTPEQYVEELTAKANEKIAPLNCGDGPCSYFAEHAIRLNVGDERAITRLPENPAEGRLFFETAASLHLDGHSLEINGIPIDGDLVPRSFSHVAHELLGAYYNELARQSLSLTGGASRTSMLDIQAMVLGRMREGEVMYLGFHLLNDDGVAVEAHAINVLRYQNRFFCFDQTGLIMTEEVTNEEDMIDLFLLLKNEMKRIYPDYEMDLSADMFSVRIVE